MYGYKFIDLQTHTPSLSLSRTPTHPHTQVLLPWHAHSVRLLAYLNQCIIVGSRVCGDQVAAQNPKTLHLKP